MSQTQKFTRIITRQNKRDVMTLAWDVVGKLLEAHESICIEVREKHRTLEQNAKLHAMLSDIAQQATYQGDRMDIDGWKNLFVSGHTIATKEPYKLVMGLEGELVNVRERTSKMGVRRSASLIEYVGAWAAENGVEFRHIPMCRRRMKPFWSAARPT